MKKILILIFIAGLILSGVGIGSASATIIDDIFSFF